MACNKKRRCSSVVEHFLGKEEVDSSILFNGSQLTVKFGDGKPEPNKKKEKIKN